MQRDFKIMRDEDGASKICRCCRCRDIPLQEFDDRFSQIGRERGFKMLLCELCSTTDIASRVLGGGNVDAALIGAMIAQVGNHLKFNERGKP